MWRMVHPVYYCLHLHGETVYWSAPRRNLAASPNLLRCRVNPIKASHPTLAHMISSRNSHVSNSKTKVSIEVFFHLCNWLWQVDPDWGSWSTPGGQLVKPHKGDGSSRSSSIKGKNIQSQSTRIGQLIYKQTKPSQTMNSIWRKRSMEAELTLARLISCQIWYGKLLCLVTLEIWW